MIELELKARPSEKTLDKLALNYSLQDTQIQKNHYFARSSRLSLSVLNSIALSHLPIDEIDNLESKVDLLAEACLRELPLSIRTRSIVSIHANPQTLLIAKYSLNDESSENGTIRREIEIPVLLQIDVLDSILERDLEIQSKWKRSRQIYAPLSEQVGTVCLDSNSGYGSIVEIESVLPDDATHDHVSATLSLLRSQMDSLHCREISGDTLSLMFATYSSNWELFYADGKTFADFPEYQHLMN